MSRIYEAGCKCPEIPCPYHPTPNRPFVPAPVEELKGHLRAILGYIEDGTLVRDISHDHKPGWALRMTQFTIALKAALEASK